MKAAMSITSIIDSSTKVLGPLLSGFLVVVFGAKQVFIIDSATFMISAILLLFLPHTVKKKAPKQTEMKQESFIKEVAQGLLFIKSNRFMLVGLLMVGVSLLILQLSDSQLIILLRELKGASPDLFGYIVAGSGSGMFLAGFLLAKKTDYQAYSFMLLGVFGIGISFVMIGVLTYYSLGYSIIWAPALGFIGGFSASLIFVPFQVTVQIDTPVHMTGRVFGVINSIMTTATIIGPLLGGWLATFIGVIPTFILTAGLLVLLSVIGYFTKHNIERRNLHGTTSERGTSTKTTG